MERAVAERQVDKNRTFTGSCNAPTEGSVQPVLKGEQTARAQTAVEDVVIVIRKSRHRVPYRAGDTLLETARRAGLRPPASCENGDCGTCMARLSAGKAEMRCNNVLTAEEVAQGYILTCQGRPTEPGTIVVYE